MRLPFDIDVINRDTSRSPIFRKIVGSPNGSFQDIAVIDGIERLYVHQRVGEHPLYISYGQSVDKIYAGWRAEAWRIGLLMAALCATNIALIAFVARALKFRAIAENRLFIMATTDALTGPCNLRRFDEALELEWRRALRAQKPVALLMIDADQFKAHNDELGHQAGDNALVAIAQCLAGGVRRASDVVARYGGEEFVLLLPETAIEDALVVAERIRANVLSLRMLQQGRPDITPTISIGFASMVPRMGLEPADLLRAADNALYEAKATGRNRSVAAVVRLAGQEGQAA